MCRAVARLEFGDLQYVREYRVEWLQRRVVRGVIGGRVSRREIGDLVAVVVVDNEIHVAPW